MVMVSPSRSTLPAACSVPVPALMRSAPAPVTQGRPMPRATTAAWLVVPPRMVRTPSATCMPWMSSG